MPNAIGAGLYLEQLKAQTSLAYDAKKCGLHLLKFPDVCHATDAVKHRHLARHLNFAALFDRNHAKGQLLLMASLDEVKVTHFKNLKMQLAIGKQAV